MARIQARQGSETVTLFVAPARTRVELSFQRALARLSRDSVLAIAPAHNLPAAPPQRQPDVAVAAIRAVVDSVRHGKPLVPCRTLFTGRHARCLTVTS
jgi:hypothetical protein